MSESHYAWTITHDHLEDDDGDAGRAGPRNAPDELLAQLPGNGWTFRMYDDDGELYYTGKMTTANGLTPGDCDDDADACDVVELAVAPLVDFGTPNAGATLIKWHGHPEWTAEYC